MQVRLGDVLVGRGVLTTSQLEEALRLQRVTHEPLGVICERHFHVEPEIIEQAWEVQYLHLTRRLDPRVETFEDRALDLVTRRQAWQFRVLPIRFDGEELMMATTARHLRRALRFATKFIGVPVFLVVADPLALGEALCRRYPLAGMTPQSIDDDSMDRLLSMAKNAAA